MDTITRISEDKAIVSTTTETTVSVSELQSQIAELDTQISQFQGDIVLAQNKIDSLNVQKSDIQSKIDAINNLPIT